MLKKTNPARPDKARIESFEELGHRGFDGGVGEGLLFVLEDEADGILLLVGQDLRATVHVEETDLPQDAAGRLEGSLAELGKRDALIEQQRKVTTDLRELGQLLVLDLVTPDQLEEYRPADLGHEHRLLDIELLQQGFRHSTGHGKRLIAQLIEQALGKKIGRGGFHFEIVEIGLEAAEHQLQIALEDKIAAGTQFVAP